MIRETWAIFKDSEILLYEIAVVETLHYELVKICKVIAERVNLIEYKYKCHL